MKWVLRIVAVLVALPILCAGVLWAMGMRSNAGRTHASMEVRGTPEQIWPWLVEGPRLKQWVSWLVEVRQGANATEGVGGQKVFVMRDENNGGELMEIPFTYTEFTPPRQVSVRSSVSGVLDGENTFRLTDLGNGRTRIDEDGRYEYRMWMAKLMEPVITQRAEAKMAMDQAKLKEIVEKNVRP